MNKDIQRLVMTLLVLLTTASTVWAQDWLRAGDTWNAATGTLTVNSNPGTDYRSLEILHLIIGRNVTALENEAFSAAHNIQTVTFEEGSQLETIGKNAFVDCSITEITIPASVKTIGSNVFDTCHELTSFTVAEGSQLESIQNSFTKCEKLTSIALLGLTPPAASSAFNGLSNPRETKFFVHGAAYKTASFWSLLYNGGYLTILYKLTDEAGVATTTPTFTSEGNRYYREGTSVVLAPGNYTVTDADGNDITATVLSGSTLTMPSCDVTITGKTEVQEDLTISTEEEWNAFAGKVNSGLSYITSTVTLAADISVSTTVGTSAHPFSGTFDGGGHTLNVSISSTEGCAAPFRNIDLATIKNLNVTGTVNSSGFHAAGLVGGCAHTCAISDCTVSTTVSNAPYAGGIVGHGGSDELTLEHCVFNGTVNGFTNFAGGLIGWCDNLTLTIDDCLMAGTLTPGSQGKYHPIACKWGDGTASATVSYTYYLRTAAATATGNNLIPGAGCKSVSATLEKGAWDEPVTGTDGNTYYAAHVTGKSLPYTYGFENKNLDAEGWTLVDGGPYTGITGAIGNGIGQPVEGNYFFMFNIYASDQYLISPKLEDERDLKVLFNMEFLGEIQIGFSTTNSEIRSFTWGERLDSHAQWLPYSDIAPVGTKYVAFRFAANTFACLDDLRFTRITTMLELANDADNTSIIDDVDGRFVDVALADRSLYKDGDWNTLCLPFDVDNLSGTPLEGAVIKELDGTTSNLSDNTLTLNFKDASSIEAGKPYVVKWATPEIALTINSDADWTTFANNVNNGTDYAGKWVKLGADINVSAMVGTSDHPFRGTFDGDGHTLKLSITDESNQGTAPFRYISDATIMNVKTLGTVTGNLHCSGLVGFATGSTNSIKNCEVGASVVCSGGGHSHCGGILGHGLSSSTTITDCLFSGTITGTTIATGIIYGWCDDGVQTIVNCLSSGTYINCHDVRLLRINGGSEVVTNCYRRTIGGTQGDDASDMSNEELLKALGSGWEIVGDSVVPKKGVNGIVNPVFKGVTINAAAPTPVDFTGGQFAGSYNTCRATIVINGNVDGKGATDAADLTALTDYLVGKPAAASYPDVNGDTKVDITDVTTLIGILTSGQPAFQIVSNVEGISLDSLDGTR